MDDEHRVRIPIKAETLFRTNCGMEHSREHFVQRAALPKPVGHDGNHFIFWRINDRNDKLFKGSIRTGQAYSACGDVVPVFRTGRKPAQRGCCERPTSNLEGKAA